MGTGNGVGVNAAATVTRPEMRKFQVRIPEFEVPGYCGLMRLWTLHPKYLDAKGLVALWREALLAKAVLRGQTVGYRNHPQLERFRASGDGVASINAYLAAVHAEAVRRGYRFDSTKLRGRRAPAQLSGTRGQLDFEWSHLLAKLRIRSPAQFRALQGIARPRAHPQFRVSKGPIASWEKNSTRKR